MRLRDDPAGPSYWAADVELCNLYTVDDRYDDAKAVAREIDDADLSPEDYAKAVAHARSTCCSAGRTRRSTS